MIKHKALQDEIRTILNQHWSSSNEQNVSLELINLKGENLFDKLLALIHERESELIRRIHEEFRGQMAEPRFLDIKIDRLKKEMGCE